MTTIDIEKAEETSKHGFLISDGGTRLIWVGGGTTIPTHNAPIGSRYFKTDGKHYKQAGPGSDDWVLISENQNGAEWLTHYTSFSPSRILREFGKSDKGFNSGHDIRLLELHVQFIAEHTTQTKIRVRLYRYNASTQTDHLILEVNQQGVPTRDEYYSISDVTPDTNNYDLDTSEGDTLWIEIDDGSEGKAYKIRELTTNIKYQKI